MHEPQSSRDLEPAKAPGSELNKQAVLLTGAASCAVKLLQRFPAPERSWLAELVMRAV